MVMITSYSAVPDAPFAQMAEIVPVTHPLSAP
jgi:hypothetical protein